MLIWMCALHCEAKPVIDCFHLKKSYRRTSLDHYRFDHYKSDNMSCIVSGMGLIQMAAATAWAAAMHHDQDNLCWINLGIAGARSLALGTTVITSEVTQSNCPSAIYSIPLVQHDFLLKPVISQIAQQPHYHDHALFDMEAYAFFQTASHFTSLELCQSVKVISDNDLNPPDRDKARISKLIANNMAPISVYALQLHEKAHKHAQYFR